MSVMPPSISIRALPARAPNARFEAFERMLYHDKVANKGLEVRRRQEIAFPDVNERSAYRQWHTSPLRDPQRPLQPCPSPEEYLKLLNDTFYNNTQSVRHLYDICRLQYRPVVMIGNSRNIFYKVSLCNRIEGRQIISKTEEREILPDNILGINDTVEPNLSLFTKRQRRNQSFSEESTGSAESDDYVRDAFHVFHQIGALVYYKGDFEADPEGDKRDEDNWEDIGFTVVSNVTSGRAAGVWLVFNFHPFDDEGERYHIDDDSYWGWLPNHEDGEDNQFSSAKIANSVHDLQARYELKFQHKIAHEPEYVRAVKSGLGQLLRHTVDSKTPSRVVS